MNLLPHPYGELVDRGSVTIRVDVTTAWDCTSTTSRRPPRRSASRSRAARPRRVRPQLLRPVDLRAEPASRRAIRGHGAGGRRERRRRGIGDRYDGHPAAWKGAAMPLRSCVPTMLAVHKTLTPERARAEGDVRSCICGVARQSDRAAERDRSPRTARDTRRSPIRRSSNPTALSARLIESGEFVDVSRNG